MRNLTKINRGSVPPFVVAGEGAMPLKQLKQCGLSGRSRKLPSSAAGVLCLFLATLSTAFGAENRTALIIGNADYSESPLKNPGNDARDMADALEQIGFDTTLVVDVDRREMGRSIRDFGKKLRKRGGVGLFYYAGHGMQIDNRNYLIPVDSPMEEEDEVPYESVDVGSVLAKMESAGNALNVIILDACRNNPFPSQFRSSSRGLARVEAPIGSLVVYSTAPGAVADDGDGRNGIFTGHLLEQLRTPGLSLSETVRRTRAAVVKATQRAQVPWESSSLLTDIAFTKPIASENLLPLPTPERTPEPTAPKAQALTVTNKRPEEPEEWVEPDAEAVVAAKTFRTLTVNATPADARIRIMNIVAPYKPGIELSPSGTYDVYVTHNDFEAWRQDVSLLDINTELNVVLSPKAVANALLSTTPVVTPIPEVQPGPEPQPELRQKPQPEPQPIFKENLVAQALRTIRGGNYSMGCSVGDSTCEQYEKPAVQINVPDFSIGQTEVTVGQFKRFVNATAYVTDAEKNAGGFNGCYVFRDVGGISRSTAKWDWNKNSNWKNPGFQQTDNHPVTCVSWNDAKAYAQWLSDSTGNAYRLPTEAEWEFAARAGTTTRFQAGNEPTALCKHGNGADRTKSPKGSRWASRTNCADNHWFSAPVGTFVANGYDLHDMQGNVWEWVEDTWSANHSNAQTDGAANLSGDLNQRVLRGGGWDGGTRQQRLSARRLGQKASRTSMIGFRLVASNK